MPPPSIPPTNNPAPYTSNVGAPQYQSVPPQPSPYAATAANPSVPPNQVFAAPPGTGSIPPTKSPYAAAPASPASVPPNTYQAPPGTGSIPPNSYQAPPGGSLGRAATPVVEGNPPTVQRRASGPQRASTPEPSLSLPKKRGTRWGIALVILAIDLGLAATGAYLLQAGL
ncbi:MAG: hypothetical protein JNL83_25155 [Myxococcales bacterium]|nr:hypothetical protein [Myxococcales bacterium]